VVTPLRIVRDGSAPSRPDVTDAFARVTAGDVGALGVLLDAFWKPLTKYASSLLNDFDAADDVVQDVFVRVWARRQEWKEGSVRALLFALTRNAALDELRRRDSRARLALVSIPHAPRYQRTPAELFECDEMRGFVDRAIQELPRRRREVFDLVYLRGLSYQDAADIMGISVKTVGNQMTAALRQLRHALQSLIEGTSPGSGGSPAKALLPPADAVSPELIR